jgi:lipid II:glycine glycyltransferase (peptidoglycan interpeptide bridge formation enzyme)
MVGLKPEKRPLTKTTAGTTSNSTTRRPMYETLTEERRALSEESRTSKVLNRVEPLSDPRWESFVNAHPRASVFHSRAWLEALRRTYGYEPVAYTTTPTGRELENGAVFCRVESSLTGRRLVSLPFSDHCELLVDGDTEMNVLVDGLKRELREQKWRYVEVRPLRRVETAASLGQPNATYRFHELDLRPDLETLLANCHKSSTQRKIQRAEREGLEYQEGSDESLLNSFYRLLVLTRRRHYLPPQPKSWFRNLVHCFGDALKIRITLKDGKPVAGMLTLRHKDTLIYKYGGSDSRFHNLGAMHLLYWESIRDAKNCGLRTFDLGRTDAHQSGLIRFKSRWGAQESTLTYWRYAETGHSNHVFDQAATSWKMRVLKRAFACAPPVALPMLGSLLYKHAG